MNMSTQKFKYTLWLLALLITAALLCGCQSKKKALDIQKQESSQQSDVKKEESSEVKDKSTIENTKEDETYTKIIEEWFGTDPEQTNKSGLDPHKTAFSEERKDPKQVRYRKTTYIKENKKQTEKTQKDIVIAHSAKSDSSGKQAAESKFKKGGKQVTESSTGKLIAFAIVVVCMLVASWYIKRQLANARKVKEGVDLFI